MSEGHKPGHRRARFSIGRTIVGLLGAVGGFVVGVVSGLVVAIAFVAYQSSIETKNDPGRGSISAIVVIFTVPLKAILGTGYGVAGALQAPRPPTRQRGRAGQPGIFGELGLTSPAVDHLARR